MHLALIYYEIVTVDITRLLTGVIVGLFLIISHVYAHAILMRVIVIFEDIVTLHTVYQLLARWQINLVGV